MTTFRGDVEPDVPEGTWLRDRLGVWWLRIDDGGYRWRAVPDRKDTYHSRENWIPEFEDFGPFEQWRQ